MMDCVLDGLRPRNLNGQRFPKVQKKLLGKGTAILSKRTNNRSKVGDGDGGNGDGDGGGISLPGHPGPIPTHPGTTYPVR